MKKKLGAARNGLRNVHWDKLNSTEGTIWGDNVVGSMPIDELFEDVGEEFKSVTKEKTTTGTKKKKEAGEKIITDGKRIQNISIMMSKLSGHGTRSLSQIANAVLSLNAPGGAFQLTDDEISGLNKAVPTGEELKKVKAFRDAGKPTTGMTPADLLILELAGVPNLKQRLSAMAFRMHMPSTTAEIEASLFTIEGAIAEVRGSSKLKQLLGTMLGVGNKINAGTRKGDAAGIKMSSLLKMCTVKTNSGYTLLEYIVMKIEDRFPEMLELSTDFAKVELAKRIPTTNISEDMAKIRMGLTQTKNGIKQSSAKGDATFEAAMGAFAAEAEETKKKLEERIKKMEGSFKELCAFLGENPPPKTKSDELFSMISRFVGQFKQATTQYKEKSARKAKKAEREAMNSAMKSKIKGGGGKSTSAKKSGNSGPPPSLATKPSRGPPALSKAAPAGPRGTPKPAVPRPPGVRGPPRGVGGRGVPKPPPGVKAPGSVTPGVPRGEFGVQLNNRHFCDSSSIMFSFHTTIH